uniref:cation transporter dimerization domain-containing protein n=1 Tax=Sphingopyxis microcysteis TaxID=2484145 RepID=UPI001B2FF23D|nr:hypothetical protein [Sphingopyxis microcysteis]
MLKVDGVSDVHELHLWSIAGDDASLTAHIAQSDNIDMNATRRTAIEMLEARFSIGRATIQTESEPCGGEVNIHT